MSPVRGSGTLAAAPNNGLVEVSATDPMIPLPQQQQQQQPVPPGTNGNDGDTIRNSNDVIIQAGTSATIALPNISPAVAATTTSVPPPPVAASPLAHPSSSAMALEQPNPPPTTRPFADAPLKKLTIGLLKTYKHINEVYYEAKRLRKAAEAAARLNPTIAPAAAAAATAVAPSSSNTVPANCVNCDDEHSDYRVVLEEKLNHRYVVKKPIGKGSFGRVVLAYDEVTDTHVAIKIIKAKRAFTNQAKFEIALLTELNENDRADEQPIVRLFSTFEHCKHTCLVFEYLSLNLYDLLRNTQFKGVSLDLIRKFAKQILRALLYLGERDIIHCDLKPENILLKQPKRSSLKVIDFGSSCKANQRVYQYIQSRFYRSPEVMLGCQYSRAIDMWSLGCILVEMHTGEPLFSGNDEKEQIGLLVASRGMPPEDMLLTGSKVSNFFEKIEVSNGKQVFKLIKPATIGASVGRTVGDALGITPGSQNGPYVRRMREQKREGEVPSLEMYHSFLDLIERMLCYSPAHRITPEEALRHPFVMYESLVTASSSSAAITGPGGTVIETSSSVAATAAAATSAAVVVPMQQVVMGGTIVAPAPKKKATVRPGSC